MIVIPPFALQPEHLLACNIPEVDAAAGEVAWNPATNYALNDVVVRPGTQMRYRNLDPGVDATLPESDPTRWQPLRYTNRWAMFRHLTNDASEFASQISFTVRPGRRLDSVFVRGAVADYATVSMTVGGVPVMLRDVVNGAEVYVDHIERKLNARNTRTWSEYYLGEFPTIPSLIITGLPPFTGVEVTVTLTRSGGRPVRMEHAAVGRSIWLGDADWSPRNDALNFSTVDRDQWGGIVLNPARSVPTLRVRVRIPKHNVNTALRARADLDAVPALWAALDDDTTDGYAEATSLFGVYRRFPIDLGNVKESVTDVDLEAL